MRLTFPAPGDIVGEVTMGVIATGESRRTVSVDRPWTGVLDHFANNINECDVLHPCGPGGAPGGCGRVARHDGADGARGRARGARLARATRVAGQGAAGEVRRRCVPATAWRAGGTGVRRQIR